MATQRKASPANHEAVTVNGKGHPRSMAVAERGIRTGSDFTSFMSSLIGDIISRRVTPEMANAACNAGGKLLKVVEMQYKYGTPTDGKAVNALQLAPSAERLAE